ncbi:MAG: hypothetical protein KGQ41_03590 [Alphaproteobacteria bacterium]|nr:hypothetical protein [Alphaproteobacteria bacterium]
MGKCEAIADFKIAAGWGGLGDEFKKLLIKRTRGHGVEKSVRCATMLEGFKSMVKRWGFARHEPPQHEAAHQILGFALIHMGQKITPYQYQGSWQAEALALAIQRMVEAAVYGGHYKLKGDPYKQILTKREFTSLVRQTEARMERDDQFERVLAHALAQKAARGGKHYTYHDLRKAADHSIHQMQDIAKRRRIKCGIAYANYSDRTDDIAKIFKAMGVKRRADNASVYGHFWYVDAGNGQKPYTNGIHDRNGRTIVARNIPKLEGDFAPLPPISDALISEVYDRALPAIEIIMDTAAKAYANGFKFNGWGFGANPIFAAIPVADISEAIRNAPKRDLLKLEFGLRERAYLAKQFAY